MSVNITDLVNYSSPFPLGGQDHSGGPYSNPATKSESNGGIQFNCKTDNLYIVVEVVTWGMSIFQFYLIAVLLYFSWIVTSLKASSRVRTGEEKFGMIFGRLLLAAAILSFFRIFLNVDTVWHNVGIQYTVLKVLKYVATTFAISMLYSILWLRQKVLYTHKMTDHVNSKYIRCLVWSVLILLILVSLLNGIFFIYPDTYAESAYECLFHEGQSPYVFVKWIVLLLSMGFFQLLLLALFIYPLAIQRKTFETNSRQQKANNLYKNVIKRVIYSTIVCMATDLIATVAVLATKDHIDHDTTDFLFDLSLFVNQMSIFYSFGDWKAKLFPWLPSSRKLREQQRRGLSFRQSKHIASATRQSGTSNNNKNPSIRSISRGSFKSTSKIETA